MKNYLIASALVCTSTFSAISFGDTTGSATPSGDIPGVTELRDISLGASTIDLGSNAAQNLGQFKTFSNKLGTFSVSVAATDNFKLKHSADPTLLIPFSIVLADDNPVVDMSPKTSTQYIINPLTYDVAVEDTITEGNGTVDIILSSHSFDGTNTIEGTFDATVTITLSAL